jgi:ankyrin repeat protein
MLPKFLLVFVILSMTCCATEKKISQASLQWLSKKEKKGNTPLHVVAIEGKEWEDYKKTMEAFAACSEVQKKNLLSITNNLHDTPIDLAICCKDKGILKTFASSHPLTITHLWYVIEHYDTTKNSIFDMCIEQAKNSLDFPDPDNNGDTALHRAVRHGYAGVVERLLAQKVDLAFIPNGENHTPLDLAIAEGNMPVLQQFKSKNIFTIAYFWKILAISNSQIAEIFIEDVQDHLNDKDMTDFGRNSLQKAVIRESPYMVELLCKQKNIDFSLTDSQGNTALDLALSKKECTYDMNKIVQRFISMKIPMTGKQLRLWAEKGYYTYEPLPYTADVINSTNEKGQTPIFLAALNSRIHTIESLIVSGASPFIRTTHWTTVPQAAKEDEKGRKIRNTILIYQYALNDLYKKLQEKSLLLYKDINLEAPEKLPTYNISTLLDDLAVIQKPTDQECLVCFESEKMDTIPCHTSFICIDCVKKVKVCPMCKAELLKLRCLACHALVESEFCGTLQGRGFICHNTHNSREITLLPRPCSKSNCRFPWVLLDFNS